MMINSSSYCFYVEINRTLLLMESFEEKASYLEEKIREKNGIFTCQTIKKSSHESILECLRNFGPFSSYITHFLQHATSEERVVFYQALLIDNDSLFPIYKSSKCISESQDPQIQSALFECISTLLEVHRFYAPIGGLIGYYVEILRQLQKQSEFYSEKQKLTNSEKEYFPPPVFDLDVDSSLFWRFAYHGTKSLGNSAEFYAVGGAGDRLNLIDISSGEPKPAACLRIFGKNLLNWLFDDIDAREFWYYKVFGVNIHVPIVLMTSLEKKNDIEIEKLLSENNYFFRDPASIFRIIQPLVPLVDQEGDWVAYEPFKLALKPGGHGSIWKLAKDFGVYKWLLDKKIHSIIIRQINNPLSGMDGALLTLLGQGVYEKRSFGFASCSIKPGFHEGLNVLQRQKINESASRYSFCLSNIEYVAFEALKESNPQLFTGLFPANVNLLYADLKKIAESVELNPFPGLLVNLKNDIEVWDKNNRKIPKRVARLESTMQNISESFTLQERLTSSENLIPSTVKECLPSFIQLHQRSKILSVTKRQFDQSRGLIFETPISFLYDWIMSTRLLLEKECLSALPPTKSFEEFCLSGPEFFFMYHPALGPLWKVIGQKITELRIHEQSHVHITLSEIYMHCIDIQGVFKIEGTAITKNTLEVQESGFNSRECVSRAYIHNVRICNRGIDSTNTSLNDYINGSCAYNESCLIRLEGFAEVHIQDVIINGDFRLIVPQGMKAELKQLDSGEIEVIWSVLTKYTPSWSYIVDWQEGNPPKLSLEHKTIDSLVREK